ncbi:hypothetical protein JI747_008695 [Chryseobacterium sp. RG1]|uniref:Uncharacterized protein n=1 Tax=Chryseobacterium tagetis TaxID=2801334 RepID=A0ABS7ZZT9_9FLAO|nr:hypothetical protein [Chryseobacterium tagetis]MCA6067251.1 hypothetical protein [Chryseobacterium tagetis]
MKTAFETAKNEIPRGNKSSIGSYLSSLFEDRYGFEREERAYVRYYKNLVEDNTDYNIDDLALDYLSKYIGYNNFNDFCNNVSVEGGDGSTTFKLGFGDMISDKINQVIITVTNSPVFNIPQMAKNGMGIGALVLTLVAGLAYGGNSEIFNKSKCMYWDGNEYKITSCNDKNPKHQLIPVDTVKLKYFKKITRPDTLTIENGLGNSWCTKSDNKVEFFTMDGINPNNGKSLKDATEHMIKKYAGSNADKKKLDTQYVE